MLNLSNNKKMTTLETIWMLKRKIYSNFCSKKKIQQVFKIDNQNINIKNILRHKIIEEFTTVKSFVFTSISFTSSKAES